MHPEKAELIVESIVYLIKTMTDEKKKKDIVELDKAKAYLLKHLLKVLEKHERKH